MKNLPNHGIASFHSTDPENIIIRDCYFQNGGATNGVVEGGLGTDGAAIVLEGQRWQAINNVIRNWARGIEIFSPYADLHGLVARGNQILSVPWQGIVSLPGTDVRIFDSIITDNIIEGDPSSAVPAVTGIQLAQMERCNISGNRISRCAGAGIYAHSLFLRNTISANSIFSCQVGITLWDVAAGTNMAHNIVSHNHIDATDHSGISVNGVNNSVLYNHITRPDRAGSGASGIRLFTGLTNIWCAAIGNTIADATMGIHIENGVRTNRVFDNHMTRVTVPVFYGGIGTIVRDITQ